MLHVQDEPAPSRWRSDKYINREYSWLQFNKRVLEEATNANNPELERLKFLSIFESNLDEFYMVRVAGLIDQRDSGVTDAATGCLSHSEQLDLIAQTAYAHRLMAAELWTAELRPSLEQKGISTKTYETLSALEQAQADSHFRSAVFPVCTPIIMHPTASPPFISNKSLNIAVVIEGEDGGSKLGRIKVPDVLPRLVALANGTEFIFLEDLIRNNLSLLFPGITITASYMFRVLRDADMDIRELEAEDLIETVEQTIHLRRFGDPILLEVSDDMPEKATDLIAALLQLDESQVFRVPGLIGLNALTELAALEIPELRFPPHHGCFPAVLADSGSLFRQIAEGDVLLHHPFDSFNSVEKFVASAADDDHVIGIKQTLYRVGSRSPIVEALLTAAEKGKQVTVMVELKARWDESNNIIWAKALERAGAEVIYGLRDYKTHCKLCLIARREDSVINTYAHIGTGNYNPSTARLYTDFGMFTSDPDITRDITELFNYLTGLSKQRDFRRLLVAPLNLREAIMTRIARETSHCKSTGRGRLVFKINSLVDNEVIDALYESGAAGVVVDLIVRGVCSLRPGAAKNIRVKSIVGRFLEHSRAFYFENAGNPELFLGSADLMKRNLERRVEALAPVTDAKQINHVLEILEAYLRDTLNACELRDDGTYERPTVEAAPFSAQNHLMDHPTGKLLLPTT